RVDVEIVLSIGCRRRDGRVDIARRHIRQELEDRQRLGDAAPLDGIGHAPHLTGWVADVFGYRPCLHVQTLSPLYLADGTCALALATRVSVELACWRELAKLVTDHIFGDIDGDVLLAVVDANGQTHHLRNHRRGARPRLDHALITAPGHAL